MEIKNTHFVITGANRGIGRAVAEAVAADKPHFHLVVRAKDVELERELLNLGAQSVNCYETNLENREEVKKLIEKLQKIDIDILFNNAGQLTGGLLENQPIEDIFRMLSVNLEALIQITHGVLPQLLRRKKGKIINHGSVSSIMNLPAASTYSAAKAAVYAFTKCLEIELKGTGVSTLVLLTPGIETRMYKDIPRLYGQNFKLDFLKGIPPRKYAQMVREAILEDLNELLPSGSTGLGLFVARHLPEVFSKVVATRFKR